MSALTFSPVYPPTAGNGLPQLYYKGKFEVKSGMTIADLRLRYKHPHAKAVIVSGSTHAYEDRLHLVFEYHPVVKPERLLPCEIHVPHLFVFVAMERELE